MDRRTYIAAAGLGVGLAGCLNVNRTQTGGGNETGDSTEPLGSNTSETGSDGRGDNSSGETSENDDSTGNDEADDAGSGTEGTGRNVTFSCSRVTVTGAFEAGDVAFASTGFYDDGLYGNTMLEDGIVFGEDVAAPFSGTVVFEIGDESSVRRNGDEIVVEIPDYGSDGTVISSVTTQRADYEGVTPTHENPDIRECLSAIESGGDDATIEVGHLETNTPIDAGSYLEVTAALENTGERTATRTVRLVVGHTPEEVDSRTVTLSAGETTTVSLGYETPTVDNDEEFPVRVRSGDDAATRSVLVYGTE